MSGHPYHGNKEQREAEAIRVEKRMRESGQYSEEITQAYIAKIRSGEIMINS